MDWYERVKSVLPQELGNYMEYYLPEEEVKEPDFKDRVEDFIAMHIGKSSTNDLSIRVYAALLGKKEEKIRKEFIKSGY